MGFFDDLEDDLEVPADMEHEAPDPGALGLVADKLAAGWEFSDRITSPGKGDGEFVDQEFSLSFRDNRYVWSTRLVRRRGKYTEPQGETVRHLDRAGLTELLTDQRLVARKVIAAAGGRVPEIDPHSLG